MSKDQHLPVNARARFHPTIVTLVGIATLLGAIWVAIGPLQPGWNAIANNGNGSGSRTAQAASASQVTSPSSSSVPQRGNPADPFSVPFTASLQGTMTQNGPDTNGAETLRFTTTLSDGAQGTLNVVLQGRQDTSNAGEGNSVSITSAQVMLGENATPPLYQGYLTGLRAGERWRMEALLAKVGASTTQVQVQIEMRVTDSGQISGLIQGTPIQGSSTFPGTQQE